MDLLGQLYHGKRGMGRGRNPIQKSRPFGQLLFSCLESDRYHFRIHVIVPGLPVKEVEGQLYALDLGDIIFLQIRFHKGDIIDRMLAGVHIAGEHRIDHEPVDRDVTRLDGQVSGPLILNGHTNGRTPDGIFDQAYHTDGHFIAFIGDLAAFIKRIGEAVGRGRCQRDRPRIQDGFPAG